MKKVKAQKVPKPRKEPSLVRQVVEAWAEIGKVHKARRLLCKQEWSIDFLVMLLKKASEHGAHGLHFILRTPAGQELHIVKEQGISRDFVQEEKQALDGMTATQVKNVLDQMYKNGML